MKKKSDIKKIIKARINHQQQKMINKTPVLRAIENSNKKLKNDKVDNLEKLKETYKDGITKLYRKDSDMRLNASKHDLTQQHINKTHETYIQEYKSLYKDLKTNGYIKKNDVDFDVIICISSYNRYDKLIRLLNQFYNQKSKYSFKIIFLDDGSTDSRYEVIKNTYSEIDYNKNKINNGREKYWFTVTQLWQAAKKYTSNTLLMIDDDFILCEDFLNVINDFFFHIKEDNNNVIGIAPHLHVYAKHMKFNVWWYNNYSVDGICLFDRNFIEEFNYQLEPVSKEDLERVKHAHGWSQIQRKILLDNKFVYKTKHSIAFHDGNDESKLGKDNKKKSKAYTCKFLEKNINILDLVV